MPTYYIPETVIGGLMPPHPINQLRKSWWVDQASAKLSEKVTKYSQIKYTWYPPSQQWGEIADNTVQPCVIVRKNLPMTGLVIFDFEERGNGGRAWKVKNPSELDTTFDIRETQLLQCILQHGIGKGGVLGGEWVWAVNGGHQSECLLVGGTEHAAARKGK